MTIVEAGVRPRPVSTTPPTGPRARKRQRPEPFTVISYVGVIAFALICVVPFWMIIAGSLTAESSLSQRGYSFWPDPFSLDAYTTIFAGSRVWLSYGATLFITVVGTVIAVAATSGIAWVIARGLPWMSRPLAVFAYIPMLFTGGLVPMYILITQVLQLRDSWFAVILPLVIAPFLVFVQVSFFRATPQEILDAARIDGAGELRIFFQVVLPLSKPVIAVIALFYAVTFWNEWFHALLFISEPAKYPLQLVLQNLITSVANAADLGTTTAAPVYQMRLAMTVITIGPILLAYPFAQRYFVKGLTLGATKG
ncbi:carbohydrate ABC transporter membrane protein 2 (CUT1 family) [Promicromonospora sp. AC04]|uniref:carbohydrate ABC transporter permease n=1 Tax=Promicromonospora sp. AC04 TaxID=2135723 RepID=UPI000D3B8796|nr:carbohydrate ABC transporter permease [Promicromonospora sp. AC04]PUB30327.1 carbohydrate ABC transporter membrane protein 2 (CUT1 family) [Promicromonospora sp. AC04]